MKLKPVHSLPSVKLTGRVPGELHAVLARTSPHSPLGGRAMHAFRQLIHGRVDRADHQRLKAEAAARGISLSKCVGDVVREYFALRSEMLSVINSQGIPGDGHPGLIHSLVARMEERLGTRADARADELAEGQRRLEIMLDRFLTVYLVHTWEVP